MLKEEKLLFALNDVSDRQLEETRKRLGYGEREKRRVRPRRIGRVLLIAALISTLFVTTAFAAGWFGLGALKAGTWRDFGMSSLAGTMESPEGQARRDWLAVLSAHENDPYDYGEAAALGEEYQRYWANNPAMAAELDAILEKNGLRMEGAMSVPTDEKSFYEAAGVGKLTGGTESVENVFASGYVYPVGSFHMEGTLYPAGEDYGVGYQLVRSVKGCFSMAMANWGDVNEYEEWDHTSPDGTELHLALRRGGHGAMALADGENSFTALNLLPDTWVDHIGDGKIDGIGDAFVQLSFTREQVESLADAFRWAALSDPSLGMDEDFAVPAFEPTGSLLDLVDKELEISDLPEEDQVAISCVYTAQIAPYLENFDLVDYALDSRRDGWIAFTGEPKTELDWAKVETAAGELYCRSVQIRYGEDGMPVPGASFDMLPYERLSTSRNLGTREEPDYIWLGTEIPALSSAQLYVQQLDKTFTISDAEHLDMLRSMLRYEEYGDPYLHGEGWNPLYLDFADGGHALAYTAADGADAVSIFGGWQGYGLGLSLFDLFGVPLESAGYSEHDGLVTVSTVLSFGNERFTVEKDFRKNGLPLEKRWLESGGLRSWEYDEAGRLVKETNSDEKGVFSVTSYIYDESGCLLQQDVSYVRNGGWEKLVYEYDSLGRLTAEIHTDNDDPPGWTGGNRYYSYDTDGNCRMRMGYQEN